MAAFYQKFLRKHLDLSSLSVMRREDNDPYFCTPKGASIFGWAGVDGIHFCFVRGFGETVFAVSPMNGGKDCVHVIARDFSDFLRLLLVIPALAGKLQMLVPGSVVTLRPAGKGKPQPFLQLVCLGKLCLAVISLDGLLDLPIPYHTADGPVIERVQKGIQVPFQLTGRNTALVRNDRQCFLSSKNP